MTPKIIWIAWNQGENNAPSLVQECIKIWRLKNPAWDVRVISKKDWEKWIYVKNDRRLTKILSQSSQQLQSDWLRLNLLDKYGGVWADSTTLCRQSLDRWLENYSRNGFFVFRKPGGDRIASSWFIASPPRHKLMAKWKETFRGFICRRRPIFYPPLQARLTKITRKMAHEKSYAWKIWDNRIISTLCPEIPYFAVHYSLNKVVFNNSHFVDSLNNTPSADAEHCHWLQFASLKQASDQIINIPIAVINAPVQKLNYRTNDINNKLIRQFISQSQ